MDEIDLDRVSLKDIRLFDAMFRLASLTEAAHDIGLTQSTASHTLAKLRDVFDDRLFERSGNRLAATHKAQNLHALCSDFLRDVRRMQRATLYAPEQSQREFRICATEYEASTILSPVFANIRKLAPGAHLTVVPLQTRRRREDVDLWITPYETTENCMRSRLLYRDPMRVFYDASRREAPLDLEDFCAANHGIASFDGKTLSDVDEGLKAIGRTRTIRLVAPSFCGLVRLMTGTDIVTTLPLGMSVGPMARMKHCTPPIKLADMPLYMQWHVINDSDPGHIWLRAIVLDCAASFQPRVSRNGSGASPCQS